MIDMVMATAEGRRTAELFRDELFDLPEDRITEGDAFTAYAGIALRLYEQGELDFGYVDNLQGEESGVDENGNIYKRTGPALGRYHTATRKLEVNSKYRGDDAGTLAVLAHEIYHMYNPDEGNEIVAEYMAGRALYNLSEKSELARTALHEWQGRWNKIKEEGIKKYGKAYWDKGMRILEQRAGYRYLNEETGAGGQGGDIYSSLIKTFYNALGKAEKIGNQFIRKAASGWTTLELDQADTPDIANFGKELTEAVYQHVKNKGEYRKTAAKEKRTKEEGAREDAEKERKEEEREIRRLNVAFGDYVRKEAYRSRHEAELAQQREVSDARKREIDRGDFWEKEAYKRQHEAELAREREEGDMRKRGADWVDFQQKEAYKAQQTAATSREAEERKAREMDDSFADFQRRKIFEEGLNDRRQKRNRTDAYKLAGDYARKGEDVPDWLRNILSGQ